MARRGAVPAWLRRVGLELAAVGVPAVTVLWAEAPFSWSVVAALVGCALVPLRHVWPPLALVGGMWGLAGGLGWPAAIVALYALGKRSRDVWAMAPWLVATVVVSVAPVLLTQALPWQRVVLTIGFVALYAVAPAVLGMLVSTRHRLTESLQDLRLARESAVAASQDAARAQERARIGREIHDVVGHHATLIAVGAAALAASTSEPETRQSAEQIRLLAKRALAEMRVALGLADDRGDQNAGLAELAALVAGVKAAGVDVEITQLGEPAELGPGVGRAVYRVAQESLTNAVRHAPGAPVRMELRWQPEALHVQVHNPARRRAGAFGAGGAGLVGLTERVASVGGELSAGHTSGDGFTVHATFPLPCAKAPVPRRRGPVALQPG